MKPTSMIIRLRRVRDAAVVRATVPHAAWGGKRIPAAAVAGLLAATATTPATGSTVDAWHVGPVPAVRAICHAGDSLYVGTAAGLFIVDVRDPSRVSRISIGPRLPSNSVRAIAARGDSVFVGTDAGLVLLRGERATVFDARTRGPQGAAPVRHIREIAFGARGEILLATRGHGVGVLGRSGGHSITRRDSLLDDDVFDILDRPGRPRLYATAAGLCAQLGDTLFVSFQAGAGIPRGAVHQVEGGVGADAYVRVARRGVFRFDGVKAQPVDAPADLPVVDAVSISAGPDGALWAAAPGWIAVARERAWKRVEVAGEDPGDWRVVVADGSGAFAGSSRGVVLAIGRGADMRVALDGGLPAPAVPSIVADGRGGAWMVCGGRLLRADAEGRRIAVENAPLDARAVGISPAGDVLVAGRWTVSRGGAGEWRDLRPSIAEVDASFTAVTEDGDGVLWVGAASGSLFRFDGATWLRYARARSPGGAVRDARPYRDDSWSLLAGVPVRETGGAWSGFAGWDSSATVRDLARAPAGEWVAATTAGLFAYDDTERAWRKVSAREIARAAGAGAGKVAVVGGEGNVTSLAFDAAGRLFLGTVDGVEWVGKDGTGRVGARDGLGGEGVCEIVADDRYLWVGFDRDGFSVVPLAQLK